MMINSGHWCVHLCWRFIVSGEELKSSISPTSVGIFRFDTEYALSKQMVRPTLKYKQGAENDMWPTMKNSEVENLAKLENAGVLSRPAFWCRFFSHALSTSAISTVQFLPLSCSQSLQKPKWVVHVQCNTCLRVLCTPCILMNSSVRLFAFYLKK